MYILTQIHWGQGQETYVAIVCRMESWHHVYVSALVRTHIQDVHWCGLWPLAEGTLWVSLYVRILHLQSLSGVGRQLVCTYLLLARSLTDQLVSLIGFWSRLCSLSPEVSCPYFLTGPQECLGDHPSGRLGKLGPSFRLLASVGRQDSQREGLWVWQLWANIDKVLGLIWADMPSDRLRSMGSVDVEMALR